METPWSSRVKKCRNQFASKRNERIRKEIVALMDNPRSVLEVGAGTQELEKHLDCDYVSCDFELGFGPDVVADARNLPFKDNAFDTVATKNLLQHLLFYEKAISEIIRVASKDIVLAERVWNRSTRIVSKTPVLRRRFDPRDLLDELGDAEFKISESDGRLGLFHKTK